MTFQRFYFEGAHCRLSALAFNEADARDKPPLVLVHGMRDNGMSLSGVAEALADDYRVIAPDLRGHGRSENPGSYAMVQFVADLWALIDHCQLDRPFLAGHSLGGHIVSRYAMHYADEPRAVVLMDGMGPPLNDDWLARGRADIEAIVALTNQQRSMPGAADALARLQRNNPRLAPGLAQLIVEHGVEPHPEEGVQWNWDPMMQMVWQTFDMRDTERQVGNIECPVLLVTGDEGLGYWNSPPLSMAIEPDTYRADIQRRVGLFRNARHHLVQGAGHMLHYDQPAQINSVLRDFLATC